MFPEIKNLFKMSYSYSHRGLTKLLFTAIILKHNTFILNCIVYMYIFLSGKENATFNDNFYFPP